MLNERTNVPLLLKNSKTMRHSICDATKAKEATIYLRIQICDMESAKSTKLSLLKLETLKAMQ